MELKLYNDLEGLRIAMAMEEEGQAFYLRASDSAKTAECKEMLAQLAQEEQVHYDTFCAMFEKVRAAGEISTDEYLFDNDTARYLTAIVENIIFPRGAAAKRKANDFTSLAMILWEAMGAEKDSILFYDALANQSKFSEARKIFLDIKAEEQRHLVKLSKQMSELG